MAFGCSCSRHWHLNWAVPVFNHCIWLNLDRKSVSIVKLGTSQIFTFCLWNDGMSTEGSIILAAVLSIPSLISKNRFTQSLKGNISCLGKAEEAAGIQSQATQLVHQEGLPQGRRQRWYGRPGRQGNWLAFVQLWPKAAGFTLKGQHYFSHLPWFKYSLVKWCYFSLYFVAKDNFLLIKLGALDPTMALGYLSHEVPAMTWFSSMRY